MAILMLPLNFCRTDCDARKFSPLLAESASTLLCPAMPSWPDQSVHCSHACTGSSLGKQYRAALFQCTSPFGRGHCNKMRCPTPNLHVSRHACQHWCPRSRSRCTRKYIGMKGSFGIGTTSSCGELRNEGHWRGVGPHQLHFTSRIIARRKTLFAIPFLPPTLSRHHFNPADTPPNNPQQWQPPSSRPSPASSTAMM